MAEEERMNRRQIQLGFVLILLGLLTGFAIPEMRSPRLGLAAHTVAIQSGLILIALGALARFFVLGPRASAVMTASWTYAAYANWLGALIGGITGASRLTPMAGAGTTGGAASEAIVSFLLVSLSIAAVIGTSLAAWGFRRVRDAGAPHTTTDRK